MFTDTCRATVPSLEDELFVTHNLKAGKLARSIHEAELYYDESVSAYRLAINGQVENLVADTTRNVQTVLWSLKEKAKRRALVCAMRNCIDVIRNADLDTETVEKTCVRMVLKACELF